MQRFLTAFICLSTLAMAQNVIAAAPASSAAPAADERQVLEADATSMSDFVEADSLAVSRAKPERDVPAPGTMMLLVAGLSGLAAIGSRTGERSAPETN